MGFAIRTAGGVDIVWMVLMSRLFECIGQSLDIQYLRKSLRATSFLHQTPYYSQVFFSQRS